MREPDLTYQLLRNLTSPVVAITAQRNGKENGMISDAAVRASIVPMVPRVSVYIHKFNYSHDMIFETGRFAMHLLHTKQLDVVRRLGFVSGRDRDKLAGLPHHRGMLRPYPNATCRRSSRSDLSVQQGADAERQTPVAVVTDDVGLVGRAWHEIHMTVEPDGEHLAEPLPHTNLPPNAAVVRLVRARVGILHVSDRREELGAACGRHVVDEPDLQRAVI